MKEKNNVAAVISKNVTTIFDLRFDVIEGT